MRPFIVGRSFLVGVMLAVAGLSLMRYADETVPTRWHVYLHRNDARVVLAWAAAFPLLWGVSRAIGGPLSRLAGAAVTAVCAGMLCALAPAEAEKLFLPLAEPLTLVAVAFSALFFLARELAGTVLCGERGLFGYGAGLGFVVAAAAAWDGWMSKTLPPNYHDEYAYLFQAWTFLDGRFAYRADDLSPAFEQVHVLNRDVFASRYFPGTALWLMPFVAAGQPIVAMWVAHGLATGFFAMAANRIHPQAGWLAALLVGTAPGMLSFSDALLSTAPTMAALAVFLWAWLGVHEQPGRRKAAVAGSAMGFAFLTRPLSAVGIGFPFAVYSLLQFWQPRVAGERRSVVVMATTFGLLALLMPAWSYATLGTPWETPYSRYTRTLTPSHVYGFYNVERGRAIRNEAAFLPYDDWATNLTPGLVIPTLRARIDDALREGIGGRYFAAIFLVVSLVILHRSDDRILLPWLGVAGLAFAYAPYWFVGVFGFGYFAEALPYLLVIIAVTSVRLAVSDFGGPGSLVAAAWPALLVLRALFNVGDTVPRNFDPSSDTQFARAEKKRLIERETATLKTEGCGLLVLVQAEMKTAVHSTLVNNHPGLRATVVRAWAKPELIQRLMDRYPERAVYLLEYKGFAEPFNWRRVRGPLTRR